MLERVALGPEALAYLRRSLAASQRTLGRFVLALPLDSGRLFTFAPHGIAPEQLSRLREGVLGGVDAYARVAAFVVAYLTQPAPRYFVVEDVLVESGDPWLDAAAARYVRCGQEVYHFVAGGRASDEAVLQTIDNAKGYVTNAILTGGRSVPALHARAEVTQDQLRELAAATDAILVEAYDGEGFVLWTNADLDSDGLDARALVQ
jgi:hypothetical protein